jgi:hypothetical protein
MSEHWTYSDRPEDESASCKGCLTREDAIEEAFEEYYSERSNGDVVYVSKCCTRIPTMQSITVADLVDDYVSANETELPDGYTDPLFERYEINPVIALELTEKIAPLVAKIEKHLLAWLGKHCGADHPRLCSRHRRPEPAAIRRCVPLGVALRRCGCARETAI